MVINEQFEVLQGFVSAKRKVCLAAKKTPSVGLYDPYVFYILEDQAGEDNWEILQSYVIEQWALDSFLEIKQTALDDMRGIAAMKHIYPDNPTEDDALRYYASINTFGLF